MYCSLAAQIAAHDWTKERLACLLSTVKGCHAVKTQFKVSRRRRRRRRRDRKKERRRRRRAQRYLAVKHWNVSNTYEDSFGTWVFYALARPHSNVVNVCIPLWTQILSGASQRGRRPPRGQWRVGVSESMPNMEKSLSLVNPNTKVSARILPSARLASESRDRLVRQGVEFFFTTRWAQRRLLRTRCSGSLAP